MDSRLQEIIIVREVIDLDRSVNEVVVDLCNEERSVACSAPQDKMENEPDIDEADFQVLDCWEGEDEEGDELVASNHAGEMKTSSNSQDDCRTGNIKGRSGNRASGYDSDETVIFEDLAQVDDCRDILSETERRKQSHEKQAAEKSRGKVETEHIQLKTERSLRNKECPPSTNKENTSGRDHNVPVSKNRVSSYKDDPASDRNRLNRLPSQPSQKDRPSNKGHPPSVKEQSSNKDCSSSVKDHLPSNKFRREEQKENSTRDRSHKNQRSSQEFTVTAGVLEKKIESFLKERALHHAQKSSSLIDPSDLPPGVDLDQVGMDTSTSSLLCKQAPVHPWEGQEGQLIGSWDAPVENDGVKPQRIAGRLYADYSKIIPKENEICSKSPHPRHYEWEGNDVRHSQTHRASRHFSSRSPSPDVRHAPQVKPRPRSRSPRMRKYSRSPGLERKSSPLRVRDLSLSPPARVHRLSRSPSPRISQRSKSPFVPLRSVSPRVRRGTRSPVSGPRLVSRSPSRGRHHSNSSSKYRKFSRSSDHAPKHLSPLLDERINTQSQFSKSPTKESALRALSRSLSRERLRQHSRSKSRTRTFPHHSRGPSRWSRSPNSRPRKYGRSRSRSVSPPSRVKSHLSRSRSRSRSPARYRRRKRSPSVESNKAKRVCVPSTISPSRSRGRSPWRPPVEAPKEEWPARFPGVNGIPLLEEVKLEHDMERFIATNMAATGQLRPSTTSWCEQVREILPMPLPPPPPHITELLKSEEERQAAEAATAAADATSAAAAAAAAEATRAHAAGPEATDSEEPLSLSSLLETAVTGLDPNVIDRCQDAIAKLQDVRIKQGRFIVFPDISASYQKLVKSEPSLFQPWQSTLHRSLASKIQFSFTKQPPISYSRRETSPMDSPVESLLHTGPLETEATQSVTSAVGNSHLPPHQTVALQTSVPSASPQGTRLHSGSFPIVQSQTVPPGTGPPQSALLQAVTPQSQATEILGASQGSDTSMSSSLKSNSVIQTQWVLNDKVASLTKELHDLKKMLDSKTVLQKNAATQTVERYPPPCQTCKGSESIVKQGLLPTPHIAVGQDIVPKAGERYTATGQTSQCSEAMSKQSVPHAGVKKVSAPKPALKTNLTLKSTPIPQPVPAPTQIDISNASPSQTSALKITPGQPHSSSPAPPPNAMKKLQTLPTPLMSIPLVTRIAPNQLQVLHSGRSAINKPKPVLKKTRTEPLDYSLTSYQFLGDDLVLNLMDYAGLESAVNNNACISGIDIDGLLRMFTSQGNAIGEQVMIMHGLSDMLKRPNQTVFRKKYAQLVGFLRKRCYHLLLVEPPPIPFLGKTLEYWKASKEFSALLKSLQSHSVSIVWSIPLFLVSENTPDVSCYKSDIHLNAKGVRLLLDEIQRVLLEAREQNAGMESPDDVQPDKVHS